MIIEKLVIKNFRNYDDLEISFSNYKNIIIGNNAQGKTNILEAIYYLSITKSLFNISDKYIIKNDRDYSIIKCFLKNNKKMRINITEKEKKLFIDEVQIRKHSDYIGNIRTIIFCPDDIGIIKNGPSVRRKYFNIQISQLNNKYINILNEFNIVLRQRNEYLKYLKNNKKNEIYLDVLNNKYIELIIDIYKYRKNYINEINLRINDIYKAISGYDGLNINYNINYFFSDEEELLKKLNLSLEKDILYGNTMIGPHRDDFIFKLNKDDLVLVGSQGQIKMAVLALKISELMIFYEKFGEYPVLLLDDLFSELDIDKRNKVLKYFNDDMQIVMTTTDIKNIENEIIRNANIYEVEDSKIINTIHNGKDT